MSEPDVRVRLSPEGVAEVIAALRKVRAESGSSARKAAGEVGILKDALKELRELAPTIGLAAAITGIIAMGKHALESGENVRKMGQKVGATAEDLSVFNYAMITTDVTAEQLEKSMVKLARNVVELRNGNEKVTDSFDELGLSAADFIGKDTGQAFALVAEKIGKLPDGIEKSALAMELFGKGGAAIIPLLNEIATKGFAEVRKEAEEAGLIMSTEFTKAAEQANDSMKLMLAQSKALAIQFATGLAPGLTQAIDEFRAATSGGGREGFKDLGDALGKFFVFVTKGLLIAGETIGAFIAILMDRAENLQKFVSSIGSSFAKGNAVAGPIGGIVNALRNLTTAEPGSNKQAQILDDLGKRITEIMKDADPKKLAERAKALNALTSGEDGGGDDRASARKEQLARLSKNIREDELKQLSELAAKAEATNDRIILAERKLADAKASATADTTAGARAVAEAEAEVLRARVAGTQDAANRELAIIAIRQDALIKSARATAGSVKDANALVKEIEKQGAEARLVVNAKLYQDLVKLQDDYLAKVRANAGIIIALDKEIANNKRELQKFSDEITLAGLSEEQKIGFSIRLANEKTSELRAAALVGNLERARELRGEVIGLAKDIQKLGESKAAERIFEDANDLFKMAADARKLQASAAGNEAQKAADTIGAQVKILKDKLGEDANALVATIKPKVDPEAMNALLDAIRKSLQSEKFTVQVYPQMQNTTALQGVPGVADGGGIPGWSPHPRADNIVIAATAGEFMQPVKAVRHYGTDFMEAIRTLRFPRFADGGSVGGGSSGDSGGGTIVEIRGPSGRSARGAFSVEDARTLIQVLRETELGDGG